MGEPETTLEPWALQLIQKITKKVEKNVSDWCKIVTIMGLNGSTLNKWTEIYEEQIDNLFDNLQADAEANLHELTEKIKELLKESAAYCKELHLGMPQYGSQKLGLLQEQKELALKIQEYKEMIQKRREELMELENQMKDVCHALGRIPKSLMTSPLPTDEYIHQYKTEISHLEKEKSHRVIKFSELQEEIIKLAHELKYKPQLDFEREVISKNSCQLEVTDENMERLHKFHRNIKQQMDDIQTEIVNLLENLKGLWDILEEDKQNCALFLDKHVGNNYEVLNAIKAEIQRCEALKRENIEIFVGKIRKELRHYWDLCMVSQEERKQFSFFEDDLYTEDLLSLHDIELNKWKKFYNQNSAIFKLLNKRNEVWQKLQELEKAAEAPDHYKNRGGKLLKEEKARNVLTKQIPKLEEQIRELAHKYALEHNGMHFTIHGEPLETVLDRSNENRENDRKLKLSARKQQRDKTVTPGRSLMPLTPRNHSNAVGGSNCKRKIIMASSSASKKSKYLQVPGLRTAPPNIACGKVAGGKSRYSLDKKKREKKRLSKSLMKSTNEATSKCLNETYNKFKEEISTKDVCRSTDIFTANISPLALPLPSTPRVRRML